MSTLPRAPRSLRMAVPPATSMAAHMAVPSVPSAPVTRMM
jgi:hypothetical protein